MKIYVMRHGALINPENVLYGRLPGFHLSETGKKDVEESALKLKSAGIKQIFSSPMERTRETAEIVAAVIGVPKEEINIVPDLIELDDKEWTGKNHADFAAHSEHAIDPYTSTDVENLTIAGKRMYAAIENIAKKAIGDILVVSHGDPIMGFLALATKDKSIFYKHYIKKATFVCLGYKNDQFSLLDI